MSDKRSTDNENKDPPLSPARLKEGTTGVVTWHGSNKRGPGGPLPPIGSPVFIGAARRESRLLGSQQARAEKLDALIAYVTADGRVCPQPIEWNALWELLPNKQPSGHSWLPPLPLILAAWHTTSDSEKATRLREHLNWAAEHGALDRIDATVRSLSEGQWHHSVSKARAPQEPPRVDPIKIITDVNTGSVSRLEKYRPTSPTSEWKLVLSGSWEEDAYHSGYVAYFLGRSNKGIWLLDAVRRHAVLDGVTEEDVVEGNLDDDQVQAMWGTTLSEAQDWRRHDLVAAGVGWPDSVSEKDIAKALYSQVVRDGGIEIVDPDNEAGLLGDAWRDL